MKKEWPDADPDRDPEGVGWGRVLLFHLLDFRFQPRRLFCAALPQLLFEPAVGLLGLVVSWLLIVFVSCPLFFNGSSA